MAIEATHKKIRAGEDIGTEFIQDPNAFDAIARAVCAFLNTRGGTVFCGVDDNGRPVGVGAHAERMRASLETRLQTAISPTALFTVDVHDEVGLPIISIEVPEGKDRPYVFEGGVFVRRGSSTQAADAAAIRDMIQTQAVAADRWERRPSLALTEEDLDRDEIRATVREAQRAERFRFAAPDDDLLVLRDLGMYTTSGLTQAADVMFSRDPVRRHPQCRLRLTSFASDKSGDAYKDNRWFEGPLARIFQQMFDSVRAQVRTQSFFRPEEIRREDRPEYSLEAVREGLVNAFAHRDYASFSGGLAVSIYPARIEIWNAGRLPDGLKPGDLRRDHRSIPTNPDIAHVLYLRSLMERVGRGTQKIIEACQHLGTLAPKWEDRPTGVTLTLYAAGHVPEAVALNERQKALLRDLAADEAVHLADYAKKYAADVSERQARRDLNDLEARGLIRREGSARSTAYRRTRPT